VAEGESGGTTETQSSYLRVGSMRHSIHKMTNVRGHVDTLSTHTDMHSIENNMKISIRIPKMSKCCKMNQDHQTHLLALRDGVQA